MIGFIIVFLTVYFSFAKGNDAILNQVGAAFGVVGYLLLSFSLFLSSRWKKLEDWIGGLDQIYRLHHKIGMWGFVCILAHPWILALKWIPHRLDRFFWFVFPFHHRLSVNLGSYGYWLMIVIIGITLLKVLSYDKWKWTHKWMSLVFLLATFHILLSSKRVGSSFSLALLFIPMALGFFGIVYQQIGRAIFFRYPRYAITALKKLSDNVLMVTLKPKKTPLTFIPGQYAFFSFRGNLSSEQHPFTVCKQEDESISILVKARGDFTQKFYRQVRIGDEALLEGPYGRFDYRKGTQDQIWIGGGVGIAPFIAWMQTIRDWGGKASLYYCCHREVDALFQQAFEQIQQEVPGFSFHLFCTERNQHLTVQSILQAEENVKEKDVFMCGPRGLTHPFVKELKARGISQKRIHFEDFEFF